MHVRCQKLKYSSTVSQSAIIKLGLMNHGAHSNHLITYLKLCHTRKQCKMNSFTWHFIFQWKPLWIVSEFYKNWLCGHMSGFYWQACCQKHWLLSLMRWQFTGYVVIPKLETILKDKTKITHYLCLKKKKEYVCGALIKYSCWESQLFKWITKLDKKAYPDCQLLSFYFGCQCVSQELSLLLSLLISSVNLILLVLSMFLSLSVVCLSLNFTSWLPY